MADEFDKELNDWYSEVCRAIESNRQVEFDILAHCYPDGGGRPIASDAERVFMLMCQAGYESSNGGLEKQFFDRTIDHAEAPRLFEAVGLPKTAAVVRRAFEEFGRQDEVALRREAGDSPPYTAIPWDERSEASDEFYDTLYREAPGFGSNFQAECRALAAYVAGNAEEFGSLTPDLIERAATFVA